MKTQMKKVLAIIATSLLLASCAKEKQIAVASFPGEKGAFAKYLGNNVKYPESARKNNISGTVYVSYIVAATGKIENVHVIRGAAPALDSEAVRVVSSMPNWIPAEGKKGPVSCQLNLPIRFELAADTVKK